MENMFIVIVFTKIYAVCQPDKNGIKPGSNFHIADTRAADPFHVEYLPFFFIQVKMVQVLDFNNWHPFN